MENNTFLGSPPDNILNFIIESRGLQFKVKNSDILHYAAVFGLYLDSPAIKAKDDGNIYYLSDFTYIKTNENSFVKELDDNIFKNNQNLSSIELNSINTISSCSFYNCNKLLNVKSSSCKKLNTSAFEGDSLLSSMDFPNVEVINAGACANLISITELNFPKLTTLNGNWTFKGNKNLSSFNAPNLTAINGSSSFQETGLIYADFTKNITSINDYTFYKDTNLISANLNYCTNIGEQAFYNCSSLKILTFNNVNKVPTLNSSQSFDGCNGVSCYIPNDDTLYNNWKNANVWKNYIENNIIILIKN